jgi:hypothetical protein
MTEAENAIADHCWKRRSSLLYKVRLSIVYHLLRERFFDQVDKGIAIITALSATSAVASLLGDSEGLGKLAAAFTALLSLIPLVFNPAAVAKRHGELAASFRKLRAEFERAGEHWSPTTCDEMAAKLIEIEVTEPATLHALVAHCQNQLNLGDNGPIVHLTWLQHRLMHFVSFDAATLAAQSPGSRRKSA